MTERLTRRKVLALSSVTAVGLAGCSGGGDDSDDNGSTENGGDQDSESPADGEGSENGDERDPTEESDESDDGMDGRADDSRGNGDDSDSTSAPTNTVTNEIDQIEVVDHGPTDEYDFPRVDGFTVEMTVRNAGDMEIQLDDYQIFLRALDADGNRVMGNGTGSKPDLAERTIAPTETLAYPLVLIDMEEDEFAAYEITIECPFTETPTYCE